MGLRQTSEFVLLKIKPCRPLSAAGKAREKNLKMFFQERSFAFEVDDFLSFEQLLSNNRPNTPHWP